MNHHFLIEIISICLEMDELSILVYRKFSQTAEDKELKKFWNQMAQEESRHVACWRDMLKLAEKKLIPQIFHSPEKTFEELKENHHKIIELSRQDLTLPSLTTSFVLALRLEFYLAHPALERLWHFYKIIEKNADNPGEEYADHIHKFIDAMRRFGANTIELEALGETVERMWRQTRNTTQEANYDDLTGILNRRGFFDGISCLAYLAKRKHFTSAMLMIDIDHFKRVNDTLGHQAGDSVLKTVADIIKKNIRDSDILGRYGGEEFLVFFPEIQKESVRALAEKIRCAIETDTHQSVPVTASIGCSSTKIQGTIEQEIYDLINTADQFMYKAKEKGRNQVVL